MDRSACDVEIGRHKLPVKPIIRKNGVDVKKKLEISIDKLKIKPLIKATELYSLFDDDQPPIKRFKRIWNKENDQPERRRRGDMLEHRVVEVPGENLIVKLPLGVVCYRIEHQGFEYLLYLNGDNGTLKFFEKRFL